MGLTEHILERGLEWACIACVSELFVEGFESMNEIDHSFPRVGTTRFRTEMGATSKGSVGINGAAAIDAKQRTGSNRVWFQACPTRSADTFRRIEGFCMSHQWHSARLAKVATSGA